ncbi:MAG: hypothetical protein KDJ74_04675 [Notoacmeibacter sp.]|nr:hypothetical protein [Notoacmeibacter sp.]
MNRTAKKGAPPGTGSTDGAFEGGTLEGVSKRYAIPEPTASGPAWSGKRRELPEYTPVMIAWPKTRADQESALRDWYCIAAQIARIHGANLRLLAVLWQFVHFGKGPYLGAAWPTNETLAQRAGCVSEKTIKNDLNAYRQLGLIVSEEVRWPGNRYPTRLLRLAVPREMASGGMQVFLPQSDFEREHSVPPQTPNCPTGQREHCVPGQGEHSVPPTVEETVEERPPLAPSLPKRGAA